MPTPCNPQSGSQSMPRAHDPQWFDECFSVAAGPVPEDLREFSQAVCMTFNIRGICDPLYIANIAAFELLRGNGQSDFRPIGVLCPEDFGPALTKLSGRLASSYSRSVGGAETLLRELACVHLKRAA